MVQFSSVNLLRLRWDRYDPLIVLPASTSTKNPQFSDIKYFSELIAKQTVNTVPEKTLDAFVDHGAVVEALRADDAQDAKEYFDQLRALGIDIDQVCEQLLSDGVAAFEKSFNELLNSIVAKTQSLAVSPQR